MLLAAFCVLQEKNSCLLQNTNATLRLSSWCSKQRYFSIAESLDSQWLQVVARVLLLNEDWREGQPSFFVFVRPIATAIHSPFSLLYWPAMMITWPLQMILACHCNILNDWQKATSCHCSKLIRILAWAPGDQASAHRPSAVTAPPSNSSSSSRSTRAFYLFMQRIHVHTYIQHLTTLSFALCVAPFRDFSVR